MRIYYLCRLVLPHGTRHCHITCQVRECSVDPELSAQDLVPNFPDFDFPRQSNLHAPSAYQ
jgi:hypothetical protein